MPASLDTFGRLLSLERLKLDRNQLRELPSSFKLLHNLTELRARDNYIRDASQRLDRDSRVCVCETRIYLVSGGRVGRSIEEWF